MNSRLAMFCALSLLAVHVMMAATSSPVISAVSPRSAPGDADVTITISGADFNAGATVLVDGATRPSTYGSSTMLTSSIPPSAAGTIHAITVVNSDGGTVTNARAILTDFSDVHADSAFYTYVTRLALANITVGCGDGRYCAGQVITRDATSAMIARGMTGSDAAVPSQVNSFPFHYDCSAAGGSSIFSDVPPGSTFCRHTNYLYTTSVTFGCSVDISPPGNRYDCPTGQVSRRDASIMLARALTPLRDGDAGVPATVQTDGTTGLNQYGLTRSYDCSDGMANFFSDVTDGDPACAHILNIWARGLIDGFPDQTFRPEIRLTRDVIAKFIANAFT